MSKQVTQSAIWSSSYEGKIRASPVILTGCYYLKARKKRHDSQPMKAAAARHMGIIRKLYRTHHIVEQFIFVAASTYAAQSYDSVTAYLDPRRAQGEQDIKSLLKS